MVSYFPQESQLKALKETVQLCLSSVLRNQPPAMHLIPSKPAEKLTSSNTKDSKVPFQVTSTKVWFFSWVRFFFNIFESLSYKSIKPKLERIFIGIHWKIKVKFEDNSKTVSDVNKLVFLVGKQLLFCWVIKFFLSLSKWIMSAQQIYNEDGFAFKKNEGTNS